MAQVLKGFMMSVVSMKSKGLYLEEKRTQYKEAITQQSIENARHQFIKHFDSRIAGYKEFSGIKEGKFVRRWTYLVDAFKRYSYAVIFDDVEINIWIRENVKGEKETKHITDFTVQSFLEIVQIIH